MVSVPRIKCPSCGRRFTPDNVTGTTCPDCHTHIRTPVPSANKTLRLAAMTGATSAVAIYFATMVFSPTVYWQQTEVTADGVTVTRQITDETQARRLAWEQRSLAVAGYGGQGGGSADAIEASIGRARRRTRILRSGFALTALLALVGVPWVVWMVWQRRRNALHLHCPSCEAAIEAATDQMGRERECPACGHAFTVAVGRP